MAAAMMLVSFSWAAATRARINNTGSSDKVVEIRTGTDNSCDNLTVWRETTIGAHDYLDAPYGKEKNISHVCARYRVGSGWSDWHSAGCPSDDNESCKINL